MIRNNVFCWPLDYLAFELVMKRQDMKGRLLLLSMTVQRDPTVENPNHDIIRANAAAHVLSGPTHITPKSYFFFCINNPLQSQFTTYQTKQVQISRILHTYLISISFFEMARFSFIAALLSVVALAMAVASSANGGESHAPAPSPDSGSPYGMATSGFMLIGSLALSFLLTSR